MEIPAPIIRKPTLGYRRFVPTCYIEFHPDLSSYAEGAGKNYLRDCHTAKFHETRPCSTVFFKNSYIELRKNPTGSSVADTTPKTVALHIRRFFFAV